eukprot:Clim_evm6s143 gene=Clim_evmTU6s143
MKITFVIAAILAVGHQALAVPVPEPEGKFETRELDVEQLREHERARAQQLTEGRAEPIYEEDLLTERKKALAAELTDPRYEQVQLAEAAELRRQRAKADARERELARLRAARGREGKLRFKGVEKNKAKFRRQVVADEPKENRGKYDDKYRRQVVVDEAEENHGKYKDDDVDALIEGKKLFNSPEDDGVYDLGLAPKFRRAPKANPKAKDFTKKALGRKAFVNKASPSPLAAPSPVNVLVAELASPSPVDVTVSELESPSPLPVDVTVSELESPSPSPVEVTVSELESPSPVALDDYVSKAAPSPSEFPAGFPDDFPSDPAPSSSFTLNPEDAPDSVPLYTIQDSAVPIETDEGRFPEDPDYEELADGELDEKYRF